MGRELYRILPDEIKKADVTAEWWVIQEDIRSGAADSRRADNRLLCLEMFIKSSFFLCNGACFFPEIRR